MILNENKIYKKIKNVKYSLIYFWAPWCLPCLNMIPIINKIYKLYNKKIYIKKINIFYNNQLYIKYNVLSIPTLIFLKKGKEIYRNIGIINYYNLIKKLNNFFLF
ncbi:thioredoxin family protein [Candidatus Shikimatogenerans bostrichidophilus]|uniref:thioredoxin family protein n=1 Tax=Candidatus Shikimatogenerans bostrichidophilus TaxID=2943807 RepID=UPI0029670DE1